MTEWPKIISAGVGPIIVISACGLLCLAFYNRLAAVVTRLRSFHRERLHEQDALDREMASSTPDEMALVRHRELLGMLEVQTRHVTRRARWIRRTIGCLLLTIACLAACSLCVGLSTLLPALIYPAVVLFIVGLLLLIVGVIFAMIEMKFALDPVELESRFVRDIGEQFERAAS
jgi:hypothetical protein